MMKKLILVFSVFLLISILLVKPIFAQQPTPKISILAKDEVINKDYLASGNTVTISGTVNGDVYAAGGTVDIDGTVNGDVIAAGGNILITGNVKNDVRVAGGNITISGAKIGGNVTLLGGQILITNPTQLSGSIVGAGGSFSILSPVGKGITIAGGQINIANTVDGDVTAGVRSLTFENGAHVSGKVSYWSNEKANVMTGATISGTIQQFLPPQPTNRTPQHTFRDVIEAALIFRTADLLVLLIVGLLLISLLPVYTQTSLEYITKNFWMALIVGLIASIVTPAIIIILLVTLIGIPLAIVLLVMFVFCLWLARIFALIAIGRFILAKTNNKTGNNWSFIVGLFVYFVLNFIPIVSNITHVAVVLSGLGTFIMMKKNYFTMLRTKKLI